ncbi:NucA/NucB deoxyribonuclease domain-containing protein [Metabacillus fastidiosus]|uniref:NucA/NucB deoxyribonuclease domain-containing protein n=1 Tax=Metabacillus fastidiosus TaxID=1458 RepID=UPI003D27094B
MIENAQEKGLPLENLERGEGTRAAQKNRYEAQKQIRKEQGPPPKGYDYDQYPYASTKQGGSGAHVEPVFSDENQAVGRDLRQFYRKHGITTGGKFDVKITE